MKTLNTDVGIFGPFATVVTMADQYRCDGVGYQFSVIGNAAVVQYVPPATVAVLPTVAEYTTALESMYDAKARERRYDSRITCALRAGYAGPFQSEGQAFAIWMDNCNAASYVIMGAVNARTRTQPTIAELLAMMPVLVWPA